MLMAELNGGPRAGRAPMPSTLMASNDNDGMCFSPCASIDFNQPLIDGVD